MILDWITLRLFRTKTLLGVHKMAVEYKQEFSFSVEQELIQLGKLHCDEVMDQSIDFDIGVYRKLEAHGMLYIFTARDGLRLVGYVVVIIAPDIHCKGKFIAADDGFYVHKDYRGSNHGVELLEFAQDCLKKDGFDRLHITTTTKNPIDGLLKKMGYKEIERKYERTL